MALDGEIEAMLARVAAETGAPDAPPTLEDARALYRRQYIQMSRAPAAAVATETLPLGGSHGAASLTLYRPDGLATGAAAILYLHGGGFALGDTAAYARQSARLALECGALVAFLDYRLAPEHRFPAAVDDALAAAQWLAGHGAGLGLDPHRLAVMGDSAGGNLAIATLLELRGERPFRVAGLLYPVVDMRPYAGRAPLSVSDVDFATGHYLELEEMRWFAEAYLGDAAAADDPRVSPILAADLSDLPPIMMWAGECDVLRDQGKAFAERLRGAGNGHAYRCFGGLIHNFMQHAGISKRSDEAFRTVCADMRAALA